MDADVCASRMLTRPGKSKAEAEARCYEAEAKAENLALRPRWPQGLNIPGARAQWRRI